MWRWIVAYFGASLLAFLMWCGARYGVRTLWEADDE